MQGRKGLAVLTIKLGGSAMDDRRVVEELAQDISEIGLGHHGFIIVHGGGKEISREMESLGIEPVKVAGLRVTDDRTMAVVESVLSRVNERICSVMEAQGLKPKGIIGTEGLLLCKKLPPVEAEGGKKADLGRVGEVVSVKKAILEGSLAKGEIPVVAPIGSDPEGIPLNVNADTAAGSIAGACSEEFILLTDVDGVLVAKEGRRSVAESLTLGEIDRLVSSKVIKDGMIPKVEACRNALASGVKVARIVNGLGEHPLRSIISGVRLGTRILP